MIMDLGFVTTSRGKAQRGRQPAEARRRAKSGEGVKELIAQVSHKHAYDA
jgi:hypothetical protein